MHIDFSHRGLQELPPGELSTQAGSQDASALQRVAGLNLSHNALTALSGLQGLTQLTVLDLSFNGLTSLDGGLPLGLISLDVSHNNLSTLKSGALLPLKNLTVLRVACNRLMDLKGVCAGLGNSALRLLDASGNQLATLNGIENCDTLEELHVEQNMIKEAADVAPVRRLPRLRALLLKENPILLRKRQVQALHALLPRTVEVVDAPSPSTVASMNTSTVSVSTAATAVEIEEMRRGVAGNRSGGTPSANTSWETRPSAARRDAYPQPGAAANSTDLPHEARAQPPRSAAATITASIGVDAHVSSRAMNSPPRHVGTAHAVPNRSPGNGSNGKQQNAHIEAAGRSPINGVGGLETSPSCPRRQLPDSPHQPVPRLQPYFIGSTTDNSNDGRPPADGNGIAGSQWQPSSKREEQMDSSTLHAQALMLRSSLLDRVVSSAGDGKGHRGGGLTEHIASRSAPTASLQGSCEHSRTLHNRITGSNTARMNGEDGVTATNNSALQVQPHEAHIALRDGPRSYADALQGAFVSRHAPAREVIVIQQALEEVTEERDAYRRLVQSLTAELETVRQAMQLERENTAVVLCINEQLQHRLQVLTGARGGVGATSSAPTAEPQRCGPSHSQKQQQQQQQQQRQATATPVGQVMPPLAPPLGTAKTPKDIVLVGPASPTGTDDAAAETIEMDVNDNSVPVSPVRGGSQARRGDPATLPQAVLARQKAASLMAKLRRAPTTRAGTALER